MVSKGARDLKALTGPSVNLVELSVSHYLLARALESVGLAERDLAAVVNTSDADIVSAFTSSPDVERVVTWNPLLAEVAAQAAARPCCSTRSQIPGEIIDMMVVNTEMPEANPAFGKALVGAWYETMALMAAATRPRSQRATRHGRGIGHRSRRLRRAARLHQDVLRARRGGRLRDEARI